MFQCNVKPYVPCIWYDLTDILGNAVTELVEALRYKPEGRGFDSLTVVLGSTRPLNRNVYHEYFLEGKGGWCIGLTTLPPSCVDCHEIWEPRPPGALRACPGIAFCRYLDVSLLYDWDDARALG